VARGLFVTGTDTGVGKTVVSAALLLRYRSRFAPRYWKPIQTGIEQDDDTAEVRRLATCAPHEVREDGVRLRRPVSPHLAARLADVRIDLDAIGAWGPAEAAARWVVEGAGGVLVPINESAMMIDVMTRLALPVLVVARSTLGTINHTLLTLEALRSRGLRVAGVVMVGEPDVDNRVAIESYGRTNVVGELPRLSPLTPATLEAWAAARLDRGDHLMGAFE
jgi:dethiobiotin synthetase